MINTPANFSLAPGFSPVVERGNVSQTVSTVSRECAKPLKRLNTATADHTGLKPGANEM